MRPESFPSIQEHVDLCYSDAIVLTSLQNTSWFHSTYIEEVVNSRISIAQDENGLPKDLFLKTFLRFPLEEHTSLAFAQLNIYVHKVLVSEQGNLRNIFVNPLFSSNVKFINFISQLGFGSTKEEMNLNLPSNRRMDGEEQILLKCLIAPLHIREVIITRACSWQPEDLQYRRQLLLWSEMVRILADDFMVNFKSV